MRFYGNKKWIQVEGEIESDRITRFMREYGDTITLFFEDGTAIFFPVTDIIKKHGHEDIKPANTYLELAKTALELFISNNNSLISNWSKAVNLEKQCLSENICMIFIEFQSVLIKRIANVNGNMVDYFNKYSAKRIDFRGVSKKPKRFIRSLFEYPAGTASGWPINKVEPVKSENQNESHTDWSLKSNDDVIEPKLIETNKSV